MINILFIALVYQCIFSFQQLIQEWIFCFEVIIGYGKELDVSPVRTIPAFKAPIVRFNRVLFCVWRADVQAAAVGGELEFFKPLGGEQNDVVPRCVLLDNFSHGQIGD